MWLVRSIIIIYRSNLEKNNSYLLCVLRSCLQFNCALYQNNTRCVVFFSEIFRNLWWHPIAAYCVSPKPARTKINLNFSQCVCVCIITWRDNSIIETTYFLDLILSQNFWCSIFGGRTTALKRFSVVVYSQNFPHWNYCTCSTNNNVCMKEKTL